MRKFVAIKNMDSEIWNRFKSYCRANQTEIAPKLIEIIKEKLGLKNQKNP
jgi:hypothetical protein